MCCSKYPPVAMTALYFLVLSTLFYQIFLTNGLYVLGPANIKLLSVESCPDIETKSFLDLNISDYNETAQILTGTFYFPFLIDDSFKVTLRGMRFEDGEWVPDKTYINDKTLCNIVDNYVWEMTSKGPNRIRGRTMCPIVGGVYEIQEYTPSFDKVELPAEMFGHVKFLLEVESEGEVYVCEMLEFENSLKHRALV